MRFRILQHETGSDNIRIGAAFHQNTRSLEDISEEVKAGFAKRGADDLSKYFCRVAIVDADTLSTIANIYNEG